MVQKKKAIVMIAGREYTIRANESEEYIHRVAIYANRKMEEIEKAQPSLSTSMIAVLTAINLADEVLKLQDEVDSLKDRIKELESTTKKVNSVSAPSPQSVLYNLSQNKGRR